MDELAMIEHFIAVGREISEIRAANRAYWTRRVHNRLEKELHERRRQRLEEIRKDFPLWFKPRCLKRASTFLNKGKIGWRLANFYYAPDVPRKTLGADPGSAVTAFSHGRLAARHTYVVVTR
jgi:hypothetical protein